MSDLFVQRVSPPSIRVGFAHLDLTQRPAPFAPVNTGTLRSSVLASNRPGRRAEAMVQIVLDEPGLLPAQGQ
jgi:hypothetical protein